MYSFSKGIEPLKALDGRCYLEIFSAAWQLFEIVEMMIDDEPAKMIFILLGEVILLFYEIILHCINGDD